MHTVLDAAINRRDFEEAKATHCVLEDQRRIWCSRWAGSSPASRRSRLNFIGKRHDVTDAELSIEASQSHQLAAQDGDDSAFRYPLAINVICYIMTH